MVAALIESMGRADGSDLLTTLQMPALVVHREQDMIPLADARAVAEGEWRVVALAAQDHTNAEIADRLFLSRYTVETHLKHVFAKLGLRSRAELAAVAASARTKPPDT